LKDETVFARIQFVGSVELAKPISFECWWLLHFHQGSRHRTALPKSTRVTSEATMIVPRYIASLYRERIIYDDSAFWRSQTEFPIDHIEARQGTHAELLLAFWASIGFKPGDFMTIGMNEKRTAELCCVF
jgi:hypothetical protein